MTQPMTRPLPLLALIVAVAAPGITVAQTPRPAAPAPVQSIVGSQNQDQPVQIEAATLEVRDKDKKATFSGNVVVTQGDTTMRCQTLTVFYGQEIGFTGDKTAAKPAGGLPQNAQNIRRIEAHGGVTVTTKDQNATGDLGVYDLKTKTITLSGNVTVSQGQNVIHGERVIVDTVTGNARVESGNAPGAAIGAPTTGRVRALIQPGKGNNGGPTNFMTLGPGKTN
jgi:lipopolysaccharide export system protein LptA